MRYPMGNAKRAWLPAHHGIHIEMLQPMGNAGAFLDGHAMMPRPHPPVTPVLFPNFNVMAVDEPTEPSQVDQSEKEGTVKRFMMEDEYYPPIVGSYKYNAVIQQFELPESVHSTTVVEKSKENPSTGGVFLRTGHHLPDRKTKVAFTKEPVTVAPNSKKLSTHK